MGETPIKHASLFRRAGNTACGNGLCGRTNIACQTEKRPITHFAFSDLASRGKVATNGTFQTWQAWETGTHFPARGLLGCIPDPLKNFVFVKPAPPSAVNFCEYFLCLFIFKRSTKIFNFATPKLV